MVLQRALSRDEVRSVDRKAVEKFGLPGVVLMENAGRGTAELLVQLGIQGPVVICAGKGNNAGDGFVIARHLQNRGYKVRVLLFCSIEELKGDAEMNFRVIRAGGVPVEVMEGQPDSEELKQRLQGADWIVDALLGTGTKGNVREPFGTIINVLNESSAKILAVDLPSGMDCDTGQPLGPCVEADHTATYVARKRGFDAEESSGFTGEVHVIDIGVPRVLLKEFEG